MTSASASTIVLALALDHIYKSIERAPYSFAAVA
jgi:hypothetical protein